LFRPLSYAVFVTFLGLFLRDWCYIDDIKRLPAYKLIAQPLEADEETGKIVPLIGKKLEEYRKNHDFLGTTLRIAEHNLTTSGIALLVSAAIALIGTFIGPI